ncbi:MAG: DNA polymerase III subunit delta [Planctomycetaceae bacterium]|jgi:DNA polymerase-3 subunit delta|nr:DNA polymerase III subunit delta [Planctomycetaceae bacterium]
MKSTTVSVLDFLWNVKKYPVQDICVVFGDEQFLKFKAIQALRAKVLSGEDAEFSLRRFDGDDVSFSDFMSEVSTRAMFGGDRRFVLLENADNFVSRHRVNLEEYFDKPSDSSVLAIELKTFPSNTNLYKKAINTGLVIESKALSNKEVQSWVMKWAKHQHRIECDPAAAAVLFERVGSEAGLLDQELAKLALMIPEGGGTITADLVEQSTGSWRTQSTFEMIDMALSGRTAEAIRQLNNLLAAGENEIGILAQIAYSLRKFASATRAILDAEKRGRPLSLQTALDKVGIKRFFMEKSERQMKMLGRKRGSQLIDWLLQTDLNLKGGSRSNPRFALETLIIKISNDKLR